MCKVYEEIPLVRTYKSLNIYGRILLIVLILIWIVLYSYIGYAGMNAIQKVTNDYCKNPYNDILTVTIFENNYTLITYPSNVVETLCDKNLPLILLRIRFRKSICCFLRSNYIGYRFICFILRNKKKLFFYSIQKKNKKNAQN